MKKLNIRDVEHIYDRLKQKSISMYNGKQYSRSLKFIECAAKVAYNISFRFSDVELDNLIYKIATEIFQKSKTFNNDHRGRECFVFFDYYPNDSRGLSEQYLNALIDNNIEFLYIVENYQSNKTKNVITLVRNYPRCSLLILDDKCNDIEKAIIAYNEIIKYQPTRALLHLLPWDVVGCLVFSYLSNVKRYMIDLTDHAFWLGTNCFDYLIEFRDFGCTIALDKRKVLQDEIILLPYYPINFNQEFKGFPIQKEKGKVYLLTGGAFYKTYGDSYKFYAVLKKLLDSNKELIILFVGDGSKGYIHQFITRNNYQQRLILLGNRTDILEVFKHSDIFLATYPIGGGLMSQFAAMAGNAIIAFVDERNPSNYPENFLYKLHNETKLSYSGDDFFIEAAKLINNESYRLEKAHCTNNKIISRNEFGSLFFDFIYKTRQQAFDYKHVFIDYNFRNELYLGIENDYYHYIPKSLLKILKIKSFYIFPSLVFSYAISNLDFIIKKMYK